MRRKWGPSLWPLRIIKTLESAGLTGGFSIANNALKSGGLFFSLYRIIDFACTLALFGRAQVADRNIRWPEPRRWLKPICSPSVHSFRITVVHLTFSLIVFSGSDISGTQDT